MKKIMKILIVTIFLFPVGYYAWAQCIPNGSWGNSRGISDNEPVLFAISFYFENFGIYWHDEKFFDGITYEEKGVYSCKDDSIFITITESNLPISKERIGKTIGFAYLMDKIYPKMTISNAQIISAGWAKEDSLTLLLIISSVNSSSWSEIKNKFKNESRLR